MAPVILEMDVHCYGYAKKIQKAIKNMPGMAMVSASMDTGQVVVEGTADVAPLKAQLQAKLRKAVTIVSNGVEPEPEPDYNLPPPHYSPPPPPAGPPMDGRYQPYWFDGMPPPPPPQYAPPPSTEGYYYPYDGGNPGRRTTTYVPNDGPTYFSDENPNACSIQ